MQSLSENLPNSLVKHALEIALSQSRALEVFVSLDLLGTEQGLVVGYGFHALLAEGIERSGVFSEIKLGANEDDGDIRGMMVDLRIPLKRKEKKDSISDESLQELVAQGGKGVAWLCCG